MLRKNTARAIENSHYANENIYDNRFHKVDLIRSAAILSKKILKLNIGNRNFQFISETSVFFKYFRNNQKIKWLIDQLTDLRLIFYRYLSPFIGFK